MDLSAVIFVALAVAWAVYLVPKALRHHDEARRTQPVERFSHTLRVLARRDAVSSRDARLVVPRAEHRSSAGVRPTTDQHTGEQHTGEQHAGEQHAGEQVTALRSTARRATQRRRRVLGLLLVAGLAVAALVVAGVATLPWLLVPATLLAAWLVACRVMVRGERAARDTVSAPGPRGAEPHADAFTDHPGEHPGEDADAVETDGRGVERVAPVADRAPSDAAAERGLWDPVPVTLPTYVQKAPAVRRSVRTIDLDATGVWTSGRTDEDARIAQADAKRAARGAGDDEDRAVGS